MLADRVSDILSLTGQSLKSLVKLAIQSQQPSIKNSDHNGKRLIILGNGPSLADNLANDMDILLSNDTLSVNFAANTPEFISLRPKYYLLMDPHFFQSPPSDPNVTKLFRNLNNEVDWDMTLYLPVKYSATSIGLSNPHIHIENFNTVGIDGFNKLKDIAFDAGRGLPRPRNVLIPSIMAGIWAGYKEIILLGADHSWLKTLEVNDDNYVVSIQPHFYKDGEEELKRVATLYRYIHLHELLLRFQIAFKSHHEVKRYADARNIEIYNATPGSYIDAFPRKDLRTITAYNK